MPTLEERVLALESSAAVQRALHRYGPALDYGREDEWVDCFTENGIFSADNPSRPGEPQSSIRGAEALRRFAHGHTRAPDVMHKHVVVDPVVEVLGTRAHSSSYYILLVADRSGLPHVATFGRYEDDLQLGTDGRWRFAHRHVVVDSWSPVWQELRDVRRTSLKGH